MRDSRQAPEHYGFSNVSTILPRHLWNFFLFFFSVISIICRASFFFPLSRHTSLSVHWGVCARKLEVSSCNACAIFCCMMILTERERECILWQLENKTISKRWTGRKKFKVSSGHEKIQGEFHVKHEELTPSNSEVIMPFTVAPAVAPLVSIYLLVFFPLLRNRGPRAKRSMAKCGMNVSTRLQL